MGELMELLHWHVLCFVIGPLVVLLGEPGHASLTREHVQVHRHVSRLMFKHVQVSDGLATGIVEAGDVQEAGGHQEVCPQVTNHSEAEQLTNQRLVP